MNAKLLDLNISTAQPTTKKRVIWRKLKHFSAKRQSDSGYEMRKLVAIFKLISERPEEIGTTQDFS